MLKSLPAGVTPEQFAIDANESDLAGMSAGEQAKSDAGRMDPELWSHFTADDDGKINTPENRDYLTRLRVHFAEFPLVVEVRHGSWADPGILDLLQQLDVGLCNIDQPLFRKSITPSAITTSPLGYIRLHGRNYDSWWRESKYYGERYDYLYSVDELVPWLDRIKTVEHSAKDTYVVTNNHYIGKGIVNAFEISSILKDEPLPMPPELVERYPELEPFAKASPSSGRTYSLFSNDD